MVADQVAVLVDVVVRVQGLRFRVDVVQTLAVEDDTSQSSAGGQRHPGAGDVSDAALVVAQLLRISTETFSL